VRHRGEPRCLGEWGRRLEWGSHRRRLGWKRACAQGATGAGLYGHWRSVRGVVGSTTSPVHAQRGQQGAATCGGAAANGVRRLARQRVETGHLASSKRSRSSPTVAFRRGAWAAGSAGASVCARTAAGVASCTTSRVGARWRSRAVGISLNDFQNCFSPIFHTKVHHKL
jgi:hypothetical protein